MTSTELTPLQTAVPWSLKWTPAQVDEVLLVIAYHGGNCAQAHKALIERGFDPLPDDSTLRLWRGQQFAERYQEICVARRPELEKLSLTRMQETVLAAQDVQQLGLEKAYEQLENNQAKDPASVAQKAAIVTGINVDKLLLVSGRPTQITEARSPEERIEALKRKRPDLFIEGTAEEVDE